MFVQGDAWGAKGDLGFGEGRQVSNCAISLAFLRVWSTCKLLYPCSAALSLSIFFVRGTLQQLCIRYLAPRQVPNTTPVLYDDWLHLDLRNTSEDILWLHNVEV